MDPREPREPKESVVQQHHLRYWQNQVARAAQARQQASEQAWQEVAQIAQMLRQDFAVTRIVVFGSLTKGRFTEESDIDLAVAGIPKERFFEALGRVNRYSQRWVDLKPLEDLDPYFRQRILSTGVDLVDSHEVSSS
ncbi:MAG: nucleotidyltransferase domain-containing protein [Thermostichus sp. BF3_bins_97]